MKIDIDIKLDEYDKADYKRLFIERIKDRRRSHIWWAIFFVLLGVLLFTGVAGDGDTIDMIMGGISLVFSGISGLLARAEHKLLRFHQSES